MNIKENPVITNPAAPGGRLVFETNNVTGERVSAHRLQGGGEALLVLERNFFKLFFC